MRTKLFLTLALASCLTVASATAREVEVKLVRFSGEIPKLETLVSLVDSKSIADVKSYSAVVTEGGEFSYTATTPMEFPTSFNAAGKPDASDTRDVGVTLSGNVKEIVGTYDLEVKFEQVERSNTVLYLEKNGTATAQPVFKTLKQTGGISLYPSQWKIFSLPRSEVKKGEAMIWEPSHEILLVRIKG